MVLAVPRVKPPFSPPPPIHRLWHRGTMLVTAYVISPVDTGKPVTASDYGVTASGKPAVPNVTVAAPDWMPFGTKIRVQGIPHVWVVQDRGGAIHGSHLDLLLPSLHQAWNWGRRTLAVSWSLPRQKLQGDD